MGAVPSHRFDRGEDRFRAHHHAGPPAVGLVVDGAVLAYAPRAQVVNVDVELAGGYGLAEEARAQGLVEQLREQRDDVEAHGAA